MDRAQEVEIRRAIFAYRGTFKAGRPTEEAQKKIDEIYESLSTEDQTLVDKIWKQIERSWP